MISIGLSNSEIENLNRIIKEKNLKTDPITNKYEKIRVNDENIHIVLYNTGKLVINDSKVSQNILNSILKEETGFEYFVGSDETGKGEWYGPLVVVAVALMPEEITELRILGVKDSKTIKTSKILEIAQKILNSNISYQSLVLTPSTYNKLYKNFKKERKNLNDLLAWAHSRVIRDLLERIENKKVKVVIDEFDRKKTDSRLLIDDPGVTVIQMKKGESETPVAAASIIAKYFFEREVKRLNRKYGLNLKKSIPQELDDEILMNVAKEHFTNVKTSLKQ